ncbi:MAG: helix-turn-helix domain-containing protein [Planctomycetes bacterium]|nr:helix-turn-helix domain-containing protein [Planctomycetota bacterium]MCP4862224.1 helix-turn-helix domain-containing protein [Planctomycetota bacterium]
MGNAFLTKCTKNITRNPVSRVGCTRQTIVLLEQGRYAPSLALAFEIANCFGQTVDEI